MIENSWVGARYSVFVCRPVRSWSISFSLPFSLCVYFCFEFSQHSQSLTLLFICLIAHFVLHCYLFRSDGHFIHFCFHFIVDLLNSWLYFFLFDLRFYFSFLFFVSSPNSLYNIRVVGIGKLTGARTISNVKNNCLRFFCLFVWMILICESIKWKLKTTKK